MVNNKVCEQCQKEFKPVTHYQVKCEECLLKAGEHVTQYIQENTDISNPKCKLCGREMVGAKRSRKYCNECLFGDEGTPKQVIPLHLEPTAKEERKCVGCGKDISNRTHLAKWCVECSAERKRQQDIIRLRGRNNKQITQVETFKPQDIQSNQYTFILIDDKGKAQTFKARLQ